MATVATASSSRYRLYGSYINAVITAAELFQYHGRCDAFSFPHFPLIPFSNNIQGRGQGGGGGGNIPVRKSRHFHDGDGNENEETIAFNLACLSWMAAPSDESNCDSSSEFAGKELSADKEGMERTRMIRGGGSISSKEFGGTKSNIDRKKSAGDSVNDTLDSLQKMLFEPFKIVGSSLSKIPTNPFQKNKEEQSKKSKLEQQQSLLSSTKVRSVSVPDSDILPPDVVTKCAKESNLIGGSLTPESLDLTANIINRQYVENGYVMNCVTGATLVPCSDGTENDKEGHVELKVREVRLANPRGRSPVHIQLVEKINDGDIGDKESTIALPSQASDQSQSDHQTFKTVTGRTRPSKIARIAKLAPGSHFCIFPERWSQLATFPGQGLGGEGKQGQSAIFSTIHAVQPVPTSQNDTVEVEIIATENKPFVSLEYGVTKSLYSDQWEGELDLKHANVFGGGEVATLNVRKGKNSCQKDDSGLKRWNKSVSGGPLNWRMCIKDDYLGGSDAGYDLEVFRDHVGVGGSRGSIQATANSPDEENSELEGSEPNDHIIEDGSPLRTGASIGLKLPRSMAKIGGYSALMPKALSARFERIDPSTKNGRAQCTTSVSTDIGPYHHSLKLSSRPMRSTLSATATAGSRWNAKSKIDEHEGDTTALPYATGTITTQQILPLKSGNGSSPSTDLTVRHRVFASSRHLPRHEAVLLGMSSRIRGYRYNYQQPHMRHEPQKTQIMQEQQSLYQSLKQFVQGNNRDQIRPPVALSKSTSGTIELRAPLLPSIFERGTIVLFGDWCLAQPQLPPFALLSQGDTPFDDKPFRHSSMGIGLRKVVQGIPLKFDACITEHGTKGMFFGLGA